MTDGCAVPRRALSTEALLYAHTPDSTERSEWHLWADHAVCVGALAAEFAAPFGGSALCRLAGIVHDAGKLTAEVQTALRDRAVDGGNKLGTPHKLEGAALAALLLEQGKMAEARVMALINFGHHHRIPDLLDRDAIDPVLKFMHQNPHHLEDLVTLIEKETGADLQGLAEEVVLPEWIDKPSDAELFARMCHSALVDADFLDTASHFDGSSAPWRSRNHGMENLRGVFFDSYERRYGGRRSGKGELGMLRWEYFEQARKAGEEPPAPSGIYRLPAPTGSGKTMSSATFALTHAARWAKRRVIVAVPFTSITTQNAEAYRAMFEVLGDDVVLEHHSNILNDDVADDGWRKLAAANWDAEFIVTTTVQLLESLFDNRPSATRKLHRIVNSVVVLDEVQSLPVNLLPAILQMMKELTTHYGVTFLLASATQPAFWSLKEWADLEPVDLVPVDHTPAVTQRVSYDVRALEQSWEEVAEELSGEAQALAIVNTTADAQHLHGLVREILGSEAAVLHLSTRMYGRHRADTLKTAQRLLTAGERVVLISTQLIEAGVDIDFPVVFRALAPADSVVQSAGRCNREGRLGACGGRVVVFRPNVGGTPPGIYKPATAHTRALFVPRDGSVEGSVRRVFGDPVAMEIYYDLLYQGFHGGDLSSKSTEIRDYRAKLAFQRTRESFQMIEDRSVAVLVNGHAEEKDGTVIEGLVGRLRRPDYLMSRADHRLVSAFSANLASNLLARHPALVEKLPAGPLMWLGEYDSASGLTTDFVLRTGVPSIW